MAEGNSPIDMRVPFSTRNSDGLVASDLEIDLFPDQYYQRLKLVLEHNAQLQVLFQHEHLGLKKMRSAHMTLEKELVELREYRKRTLQTELLLECSAALQGQRKINNLFQVVVRELCHLLNADRATLFLVDEETGT